MTREDSASPDLKPVTIFTDGAAVPNPGAGGYGVVLRFGKHSKELSGGFRLTRELIYCRFPLNDGGGNPPQLLRTAVDAVESFISKRIPTLVYCSAGMSRSVA